MLVTTDQAAKATGLSTWELRIGFKQGRYPAIEIGRGERARRLRWNLDMLQDAINQQMLDEQQQRMKCNGL